MENPRVHDHRYHKGMRVSASALKIRLERRRKTIIHHSEYYNHNGDLYCCTLSNVNRSVR